MILVSVIIPIYNCEKYIQECVESIINNFTGSYEIIIIDDESTDKSPDICEKLKAKYDVCKVFHIKNEGVSNARNFGIKQASGKWIMFVDADDKLVCNVSDYIKELSADAVYFNYTDKEVKHELINKELRMITSEDLLLATLDINKYKKKLNGILSYKPSLLYSVWGKLYKRKIIIDNDIKFNTCLKRSEDAVFNFDYLLASKNIICIDIPIYYYRENTQSVTHKVDKSLIENCIKLYDIIEKKYHFNEENYIKAINQYIVCNLLDAYSQIICTKSDNIKDINEVIKSNTIKKYVNKSRKSKMSIGKFQNLQRIITITLWNLNAYKIAECFNRLYFNVKGKL